MEIGNYTNNLIYPHNLVGHEIGGSVWTNFISSQRLAMMSKNYTQWVLLNNPEFPRIFSGIESMFGEYTFDMSPIDQDVIVLKVVKKFGSFDTDYMINDNPTLTVFYKGTVDKKIGCFDINNYRYLSKEFGYFTKIKNKHLLGTGQRIPKGTIFQESPAVKNNLYCMGVNANVVYLPIMPTTADAFVISQSLAEKLSWNMMNEVWIHINKNQVPTNMFGKREGEHKFFPDLGEYVGKNGILAALRPIRENGIFKDYTEENLAKFNPISDIPYKSYPKSKIIDVDVFTATDKWNEVVSESSPFHQLNKYHHHLFRYYDEFLKIYAENQDGKFTPDLTNKITKYALMMPPDKIYRSAVGALSQKFQSKKLSYKGVDIDLCLLRLVTSISHPAGVGSKITGRDGSKGVICLVLPDDYMPYDEDGFRADIIINSNSIPNRMNISQLWEQFINRLSDLVKKDSMHMDTIQAYHYMLDYIHDVDPAYGKLVKSVTIGHKEKTVKEWREHGIYINVPGTREHYGKAHHDFLKKKWNYRESYVRMKYDVSNGRKRHIKFMKPECIGSKYIFLINKVPHANAVELAFVSHFQLPIKNKSAKDRAFFSCTPIRFGEEEIKQVVMGTEDPSDAARLLNVSGNAPEAAKAVFYHGLTDKVPSQFMGLPWDNDDIVKMSVPLKLTQHIMAASGKDITPEAFFQEVEEEYEDV